MKRVRHRLLYFIKIRVWNLTEISSFHATRIKPEVYAIIFEILHLIKKMKDYETVQTLLSNDFPV